MSPAGIIGWIFQIAIWLIIARIVIDWIQVLAQQWRPTGGVAAVFEVIYSITDPPLNAVRKIVPPIRLGQVMLDLSPMILILGLVLLQAILVAVL